jgi:hypothetical protein
MKKSLFIFILFAVCNKLSAQILKVKEPKIVYGLHLQTSLNAPLFISYYQLNSKNIGWGLKGGFGREKEAGEIMFKGERFGNTLIGRTIYERNAEYFYITPQYVAYAKERKKSTFMLAFGLPLGFSRDKLNQLHKDDPIKGDFYSYLKEENKYVGLEIELAYWANLGEKLIFKYGITTGMKLSGDAPFQEVFENYNYRSSYYPGMYKGGYLNLQIGILFSQIKSNKI